MTREREDPRAGRDGGAYLGGWRRTEAETKRQVSIPDSEPEVRCWAALSPSWEGEGQGYFCVARTDAGVYLWVWIGRRFREKKYSSTPITRTYSYNTWVVSSLVMMVWGLKLPYPQLHIRLPFL